MHILEEETAFWNIFGFQETRLARTPHSGAVSILGRDGVGVIQRPCGKGAPESVSATLVLSEGVQVTVMSACFFCRHYVSEAALGKLGAVAEGPSAAGAGVGFHRPVWDTRIPPDAAGEEE